MTILALLVKATAVLVVALAGTWLGRRGRAAVRHVLLSAAFALILMLPVATWTMPDFIVPVPSSVGAAIAPLESIVVQNPGTFATDTGLDSAATPTAVAVPTRLGQALAVAWAAGTGLFLLPILAGFWQVRALRRSALPWPDARAAVDALAAELNIRRPIETLMHESLPGPMTCGFLRPAILLPPDAHEWPAGDLRRALVHELEHVRRGDCIWHAWARLIAACYWFNPVVWIAMRRLDLEAERACDDAVLSRSDATIYADQLIGLARRLSSARLPQLAMANRHELAARVRALLDAGQRRGRAGAVVVWSAVSLTIVLAIGLSTIRLVAAVQSPPRPAGSRPRYDVATIKRCDAEAPPPRPRPGGSGGGASGSIDGIGASASPGRFFVSCVMAEQLIYLAYGGLGAPVGQRLVNDDPGSGSKTKVRGGPDWVHSPGEKYTIEATAEGVTDKATLMGTMLQTLLEERFRLRLHRGAEDVSMYKLVVATGGLKIKPLKDGDCVLHDPSAPATSKPTCGALTMDVRDGLTIWDFGGSPIGVVASWLGHLVGAHVIDETGLTGQYILGLKFVRDLETRAAGPSIFTALPEQLGLKLEPTRGPREYLVIDAIERPTPDAPFQAVLRRP